MPVFGEYETIGGPWFMSGRHGPIRSYWRATNPGSEGSRVCFIKSIALPGPELGQEQTAHGPPPADPGADFFDSVNRLQEAYRSCPELIAPIHAFGRTNTEIWYATDLYPRHSLAQFESSAAEIDNRTLEHVVYCVASGCLALQRTTGQSHGNLKPSNVLLAGEPGPLWRTPLRLIDPAGSAAQNPQGRPAGNLRDATEARDLRGIGEIILELVESNPIDGPEDYCLPIEHSVPWRALGKNSRRWLELCNRLLNPALSLDEISLESLAKDFRPRSTRSPVFFTGLGAMAVLAIVSSLFWAQPLWRAAKSWAHDRKLVASAQSPASRVSERPSPVAAGVRPARIPARVNTQDTAVQAATDQASDSAGDIPSTQRFASLPGKTDARVDPVDSRPENISPGPAEIGPATPALDRAPSPTPAQALDSGAPAGSATESGSSKAEGIKNTESAAQTTASASSYSSTPPALSSPQGIESASKNTAATSAPAAPDTPKGVAAPMSMPSTSEPVASLSANTDAAPEGVDSRAQAIDADLARVAAASSARAATATGGLTQTPDSGAPTPSSTAAATSNSDRINSTQTEATQTQSNAPTASARPQPSQVLQGPERVPPPPSGQREAKAAPPRPARPAQQSAKGARSQAEMGMTETGKGRTLAKVERPTPPSPTDIARLNEQLRALETKVASMIAIRRSSELFDRVEALEAQYAKANQLSGKIKARFDLLRVNMARKLPDPAL